VFTSVALLSLFFKKRFAFFFKKRFEKKLGFFSLKEALFFLTKSFVFNFHNEHFNLFRVAN
jgi:hypothetical protein